MRFPWTSLAVSLAAHLLAILLIFAGGKSLWDKASAAGGSGGAGGDVVSVWISGPDESSFPKAAAPSEMSAAVKASRAADTGDLPSSAGGAKSAGSGGGMGGGDSGGAGSAAGAGAGSGEAGKSILAEIWGRIDRNKYYPSIAKKKQIEGSPRVTFEITGDGGIKWVRLAASSGNEILDDAALETVRRAAPLPYYPAPVTLAVKYSMDEQ